MLSRWHVHADEYAKDVNDHVDAHVAAVWDENPSRGSAWAGALRADWVPDLDELLARDDIDAVCVTTPTSLHEDVIVRAATAGKHIFTEKVLAPTVAQCRNIASAIRAGGGKFAISFPRQCFPEILYAKRALEAGMLGEPTMVRVRIAHDGATRNWLPAHFYDPATAVGGAMLDLGAHGMYLTRWLLGEPVRVTSVFTHVTNRPLEDNAVSLIEYGKGAIGINETAFVSFGGFFSMEIDGTAGNYRMLSPRTGVEIRHAGTGSEWQPVTELPVRRPKPVTQWIDECMGGPATDFGLHEAIGLTALMEAAYTSVRERRTVSVGELE